MNVVLLCARAALAFVFAVAAVAKLMDLEGFQRTVREFGVPEWSSALVGVLVPWLELALVVAFVVGPSARWGAVGALVLLAGFSGGVIDALREGRQPDCHCFGRVHAAPVGRATLARNGVLAGISGFVVVVGWSNPGASATRWVTGLSPGAMVGIAVVALIIAMQGWFSWQLLRSTGARLLSLSQIRTSSKPLLLFFVEPGCDACRELLPEIDAWHQARARALQLAVITAGAAGPVEQNGFAVPELADADGEVLAAYAVRGTPTAVLIAVDGRIAAPAALGAEAIRALVDHAALVSASRSVGEAAQPDEPLVRGLEFLAVGGAERPLMDVTPRPTGVVRS